MKQKINSKKITNDSKKSIIIKNPHALGILFVIIDSLGFSLMALNVRLAGDLPVMQKAFFRNAIAAVIAIIALARTSEKFKIKKGCIKDLFFRALFGTIGLILNFWAIGNLNLADANILNKMSPFFAIIASIFILSEIPSRFDIVAILISFTGALFIIRPTAGIASLPALVGLTSGVCAGIAYTFVRKLGNKGERGPVIVAFFSVFSSIVCLPQLIIDFHPMSLRQWIYLILAGVFAAAAQFAVTTAYKLAPAKEISVFDYSQVLFASIWGFLLLGELPDMLSVIGYIIIISISVIKWYYNVIYIKNKK